MKVVALRKESVDRNWKKYGVAQAVPKVALRKESVDRNYVISKLTPSSRLVALRKESVDRNRVLRGASADWAKSLSARRAWIEIWKYEYRG